MRRSIAILKYEGLSGVFFRMLGRLGFRRVLLLIHDLKTDFDVPPDELPPIEIRELSPDDADRFGAFRPDLPRTLFLNRFSLGDRCVAALQNNKILTVTWISSEVARIVALRAHFVLNASQVYLHDTYTHPDRRGRRDHTRVMHEICRTAPEHGITQLTTLVAPENKPSLTACYRHGWKSSGMMLRFGTLRHALLWGRGGAPRPISGMPS